MWKRLYIVACFILLITVVAACSSEGTTADNGTSESSSNSGGSDNEKSDGEKTTLNFWHSLGGENEKRINSMVERFNQSQNNIEVIATYQGGYDETVTKIQQGIASNTAPDISMVERAYVEMLADSEVLEDLSPYFEQSELSVDDFNEGLMGHSYFNNELLSLPLNRSTPIMHINKSMLDEEGFDIPTTWEELKKVSEGLVIKKGDEIERYGLTMPYDTWYPIAMITQANGKFFNEDNTSDGFVENGVGKEVFSYLKELQNTGGLFYPPAQDSGDIVSQMFLSEKVGIIFQSTGDIGTLEDNVDFDYVTAFLPKNDVYATPTGGANIAMLNSSEHKDAAWEFLSWIMTDSEGALEFILESGYLPFSESMVESEEIQKLWEEEPNRKIAYEQLEYAIDTNKDVSWPEIMHEFFSVIETIMYDNGDIDATLQSFKEETERILNQ